MGAGLCFEFAGSFQTEAPPTQGRAGAQSHLPATEKLRHVIIVALAPNAEFTIKDVGKDELAEQDFAAIRGRKDGHAATCSGCATHGGSPCGESPFRQKGPTEHNPFRQKGPTEHSPFRQKGPTENSPFRQKGPT